MNKKATSTTKSTVKVIGVGCGGNNIVNHISQMRNQQPPQPCKSARTDLEAATTLKKQTSLLKKTQMQ